MSPCLTIDSEDWDPVSDSWQTEGSAPSSSNLHTPIHSKDLHLTLFLSQSL